LASVEIELHIYEQQGRYLADLRLGQGEAVPPTLLAVRAPLALDPAMLGPAEIDMAEYGRLLSAQFFTQTITNGWNRARAFADGAQLPLRVRLRLDRQARALHALAWETLRDPEQGVALARSTNTLLSRALDAQSLAPLAPPPAGQLRAIALVANPNDLAAYDLAPVDVERETARIGNALAPIPLLATPRPATAQNLFAALQSEPELVYIVCHGSQVDGMSYLWLEHSDGSSQRMAGDGLAEAIGGLRRPPLLVILAACYGQGNSSYDPNALLGLGPLLAQAGVPAVIAMRGTVPVALVEQLMPVLFERLRLHGSIDRALAEARMRLDPALPWWMPVLTMRAPGGMLWSTATAAEPAPAAKRSPVEQRRIERRKAHLEEELQLLDAKLAHLRRALAIETDAAQRFRYEQLIAEERKAIEAVEQELATL
jgi:hypothetical protein